MAKSNNNGNARLKSLTASKLFPLLILYIAMIIIFTVWSRLVGANFLQISTVKNILQSLVISAFLTMGAGTLLIAGHLDLAQSSIGAFGGIVLAWLVAKDVNWILAIIIAMAICALFGILSAVMITKFHFPSFIATLAMASIVKGFMYIYSSLGTDNGLATNVYFKNDALNYLGNGKILGVPFSVILAIVFFVIYGIIIAKTSFGAKIMLMGGNPVAATLAGINASALLFILFINSALTGCVAGILNSARLQQGALLALGTAQFTGITAAVLGGISFGGGSGGMGGAFLGLLILNTFQIGMSVVGLNPFWVNVFSGILLLLALAFDFISTTRKAKVPVVIKEEEK
ncbi:MAG: ABC transporter permease [Lachnospiraceae bacterium]|nr:ABC transporter permease [Lachnospiraceae bacterium]